MTGHHLPLLASVLLFTSACVAPSEQLARSSDAIVGGELDGDDRADSRAVGFLRSDHYAGSICSGSLVSIPGAPRSLDNRVVLTAAHCVAEIRHSHPDHVLTFKFGFGPKLESGAGIPVVTVLDHPTYLRTNDYAYDVALLVLAEPVRDRRPLEIGGFTALFGAGFSVVGYGRATAKEGETGVKRRFDTDLEAFTPSAPLDDAIGTKTGVVVTHSNGSVCPGDSGGALLRRGASLLVGVTSWSAPAVSGECTPGDRNGFVYVAPHIAWMREVLTECAVSQRFFPETGIYVCGKIQEAWEDAAYGNADGFNDAIGLPLATASYQRNGDGTDRSYVTQWFERARVEHHPESPAPYDVGFGRLGAEVYGRNDAPSAIVPGITPPGCEWIAGADGRGGFVCGDILDAWRRGGGLRMLGAPISGERSYLEITDAYHFAGQVQWFERGRLERHSELDGAPVLGGKLGCRSSGFDRGLRSLGASAPTTLGCAKRLYEGI